MDKKVLYFIAALVVVGLVTLGIYYLPKLQSEKSDNDTTEGDESSSEARLITESEVSQHNSRNDCWLIINERVFDVTRFIPNHPGGNAILEGCGKDATTFFQTRPMGSGTEHSDEAYQELEEYYIGNL